MTDPVPGSADRPITVSDRDDNSSAPSPRPRGPRPTGANPLGERDL